MFKNIPQLESFYKKRNSLNVSLHYLICLLHHLKLKTPYDNNVYDSVSYNIFLTKWANKYETK